MKNQRIKAIYFADGSIEDIEEERDYIVKRLKRNGISLMIDATDLPPAEDEYFHILFFDYGGMSWGNSVLEMFCSDWLKLANECPSRIFVMTSEVTKAAMEDISQHLDELPPNVFLELSDAADAIKQLMDEKAA